MMALAAGTSNLSSSTREDWPPLFGPGFISGGSGKFGLPLCATLEFTPYSSGGHDGPHGIQAAAMMGLLYIDNAAVGGEGVGFAGARAVGVGEQDILV